MNTLIVFSIILASSIPVLSTHSFQNSATIPESEIAPLLGLSMLALTLSKRKQEIKTFKAFEH